MKRREFFRTLGGAVAAALVPAAALAAPSAAPVTFNLVDDFLRPKLAEIAQAVVGGTESSIHFQVRWKRFVKWTRQLGIDIDYYWSTVTGPNTKGETLIDGLHWSLPAVGHPGVMLPQGVTDPRLSVPVRNDNSLTVTPDIKAAAIQDRFVYQDRGGVQSVLSVSCDYIVPPDLKGVRIV